MAPVPAHEHYPLFTRFRVSVACHYHSCHKSPVLFHQSIVNACENALRCALVNTSVRLSESAGARQQVDHLIYCTIRYTIVLNVYYEVQNVNFSKAQLCVRRGVAVDLPVLNAADARCSVGHTEHRPLSFRKTRHYYNITVHSCCSPQARCRRSSSRHRRSPPLLRSRPPVHTIARPPSIVAPARPARHRSRPPHHHSCQSILPLSSLLSVCPSNRPPRRSHHRPRPSAAPTSLVP